MTEPAKRTQPHEGEEPEHPAATAMSDQERAAIRQAGADDARRSRARQGLPERIEDPAAVASLVAILRDVPAPRQPCDPIEPQSESATQGLASM